MTTLPAMYVVKFSRPGLSCNSKGTKNRTEVGYQAEQMALDIMRMKGQRFPRTGGDLLVADNNNGGKVLSRYRWCPEAGTFTHVCGSIIGTIEALKPATTPPFSAYVKAANGEYELAV